MVIVAYILIEEVSVEYIEHKELKILSLAISGEKDSLKDNGRTCPLFSFIITSI